MDTVVSNFDYGETVWIPIDEIAEKLEVTCMVTIPKTEYEIRKTIRYRKISKTRYEVSYNSAFFYFLEIKVALFAIIQLLIA